MNDGTKLVYAITITVAVLSLTAAVFINEINIAGPSKRSKTIEIAAVSGTNLLGYRLVVYNTRINRVKEDIPLTGIISNEDNGWGVLFFSVSSLSLIDSIAVAFVSPDDHIIDFISYGATFTPTRGVAFGQTSIDISKTIESSISRLSAQRVGFGMAKKDFVWNLSDISSYGSINDGQKFFMSSWLSLEVSSVLPQPFINEFQVSGIENINDGTVEIVSPQLKSLQGYRIHLYDAKNGSVCNSASLSDSFDSTHDGWGFLAVSFFDFGIESGNIATADASTSMEGLHNSESEEILGILNLRTNSLSSGLYSPLTHTISQDINVAFNRLKRKQFGIALVDAFENVIEFVSYGSSFVAIDGAAKGMISSLVGIPGLKIPVMEASMQRVGHAENGNSFKWKFSYETSFGFINSDQVFEKQLPVPAFSSYTSSGLNEFDGVPPFVNEIQSKSSYNGVQVELAAQAGTDMQGFQLVLLDGLTGQVVDTIALNGLVPWVSDGMGFLSYTLCIGCFYSGQPFAVGLVSKEGKIQSHIKGDSVYRELWGIGANITGTNGPSEGLDCTPLNNEGWVTSEMLSFQRRSSGEFNSGPLWSSPKSPSYGWENEKQMLESVFCSERYTVRHEMSTFLQNMTQSRTKQFDPASPTLLLV